ELIHHRAMEKRDDREAAAEDERTGFGEVPTDLPERLARRWASETRDQPPGRECEGSTRRDARADDEGDEPAGDEEPADPRFRPRRGYGGRGEEHPQQAIGAERALRQLEGAAGDDRDDRGSDSVERALHPRDAAVGEVRRGETEDHDERGQDERDRDQRRAE